MQHVELHRSEDRVTREVGSVTSPQLESVSPYQLLQQFDTPLYYPVFTLGVGGGSHVCEAALAAHVVEGRGEFGSRVRVNRQDFAYRLGF